MACGQAGREWSFFKQEFGLLLTETAPRLGSIVQCVLMMDTGNKDLRGKENLKRKNFKRRTSAEKCGTARVGTSAGFGGKQRYDGRKTELIPWKTGKLSTRDAEGKGGNVAKMGANGSTHVGRLKSRSQSSSALYGIKTGICGIGPGDVQQSVIHHQHHHQSNSSCQGCPSCSGHGGISSSIPADLWDLPPSTKSFSPLARKKQGAVLKHQHSVDYVLGDSKELNIEPFRTPFGHNSSDKRGKKGKDKIRGNGGRSQMYAVSCPDVAQESMGLNNMGFEDSYYSGSEYPVRSQNSAEHEKQQQESPSLSRKRSNRSRLSFTHSIASYQERDTNQNHHLSRESFKFLNQRLHNGILFPNITKADIFEVRLVRDQRGLGLSVTGGSDSAETHPGLIRIKSVFPMTPASVSGKLRPGDIILKANGVTLTGLTNNGALEVLRTTPNETVLTVCRPPVVIPGFQVPENWSNSQSHPHLPSTVYHQRIADTHHIQGNHHNVSASMATAPASHTSSLRSKSLSSLKIPCPPLNFGEFEVTLEKVNGSLGFTIRQEDSSVLGHYVRALVKDPALNDGRIQPGDKIISVNGYDLTGVSHADAISYMRQCPLQVTLRLYRDPAPTPVSPMSPTESHKPIPRNKQFRQEALERLNDLAIRKQMSGSAIREGMSRAGKSEGKLRHPKVAEQVKLDGPATLPRRRNHGVSPSAEVISAAMDHFAGSSKPKANNKRRFESGGSGTKETDYSLETRSSGSGESTPMGTWKSSSKPFTKANNLLDDFDVEDDSPFVLPKAKSDNMQKYSMHLDRIGSFEDTSMSSDVTQADSISSEPCLRDLQPRSNKFGHGRPAYQSACVPSTRAKNKLKQRRRCKDDTDIKSDDHKELDCLTEPRDDDDFLQGSDEDSNGTLEDADLDAMDSKAGGLLKWKGIVFSQDSDNENVFDEFAESDTESTVRNQGLPVSDDEDGTLHENGKPLPPRRSPDGRENRENEIDEVPITFTADGHQIFTIQLSRRWCSRLGFSLTGNEGHTFISAIYPDSVASKDGRLRVADEIIMVNGQTIRDMNTTEVIDLMRKTRGTIDITILRKSDENPNHARGSNIDQDTIQLR